MSLPTPSQIRSKYVPIQDRLASIVSPRWKFDELHVEVYNPPGEERDIYALVWGYSPFGKRVFRRFRVSKDHHQAQDVIAANQGSEEAARRLSDRACEEALFAWLHHGKRGTYYYVP